MGEIKKKINIKFKSLFITYATIAIIVFIVTLLTLISEGIKTTYPNQLITDDAKLYYNNKLIDKGVLTDKMLRNYSYGSEIIIKAKIHKKDITNPVLFFNNNINAGVRVFVDNKKVFEHGMDAPKNSIVCNDNMKIPLLENCYNKEIKVVLRCTNKGVFAKIPHFLYINSKDCDTRNLLGNITFEIGGICLIGIGIVTIALFIFNYGIDVTIKPIVYLAISSVSGGLWILSCYQLLNIFIDSIKLDFYIEYLTLFIMLLFFNYYVSEATCIKKDKIFLQVMRYLSTIYAIIAFTLQIKNILYMNDSVIGFQLTCLPTVICLIRHYIKKVRNDNKGYSMLYGIALLMGIASILYCISHLLKTSISLLNILPILLFFFITSGVINIIMELKRSYSKRAENNALLELAFIDKLTGLNNRRGLESYENKIAKNTNTAYTIYSIDLNRLKYVNDTYGHAAGDELIKAFGEQLKNTIDPNDFCGRMGGDEFIAITSSNNNNFEQLLKEKVNNFNTSRNLKYKLKYSIGSAIYKIGGSNTIDDCIRMADYNMYEMKSTYTRKNKI